MSQSKGVLKYEMVSEFYARRYGVDQLSFALLILYFVITILGTALSRIPYRLCGAAADRMVLVSYFEQKYI